MTAVTPGLHLLERMISPGIGLHFEFQATISSSLISLALSKKTLPSFMSGIAMYGKPLVHALGVL